MSDKKNVAVIGSGSWGTALANVFADLGHKTRIWGRDSKLLEAIQNQHENPKYLKGIPLNPVLGTTGVLEQAVKDADIVVCAIPTQQIRSVFAPLASLLDNKVVINTSKGIEMGTHLRVSAIFAQIQPSIRYGMLSGPTFALEVAKRLPAAITLAAESKELAEEVQKALNAPYFRVYTSKDVAGVEIAGALKNVVAIATGVATGLQLGFNAQAAIINRGIAEIMRIARSCGGADPLTFLGLAGMGDLILTCTGPLSRNRTLGLKLGEGKSLGEIQRELGGVAEGVYTAKSARELAAIHKLDMPITEQVYCILYEGRTALQAVRELMGRDPKEEFDTL